MRQALLIIDVQPSFSPPQWLVEGIQALLGTLPTVATVERHDESPKHPSRNNSAGIPRRTTTAWFKPIASSSNTATRPPPETIEYLKSLNVDRVLVCGLQTETCCLAAGFALFDAGLQPTLIIDLTVGSSLDRTGGLGVKLWQHHFKHTVGLAEL